MAHSTIQEVCMTVRVRFAPSPTGYLHMGGARTALFCWLFARKHDGTFILRIEDTDLERSTPEMTQGILDGLGWLGLDWDEGPYMQSEGIPLHRAAALSLLERGLAYRCFATPEQLEVQRRDEQAKGGQWRFDPFSRGLSRAESDRLAADGRPFVVRFRVPDDAVVRFADHVYGEQERTAQDIEDMALLRPDGTPLYNLSVVVDDIRMQVTHIIRGQDHLINTFKQVLLYQALGAPLPEFAHLPLILAPGKAKLSKRTHGEVVAVTTYKERGFLPGAFRNFLALLGWAPGDDREILSTREMIELFDLDAINRSNAVFNFTEGDPENWTDPKALWMNGVYLTRTPIDELVPFVADTLKRLGLWDEAWAGPERERFAATVDLIRQRYHSLLDFAGLGRPYFSDDYQLEPEAVERNLAEPRLREWLPMLATRLAVIDPWEHDGVEAAIRALATELGVKAGVIINAARTACTGQKVGPGLFEILVVLGRDRVVARLLRTPSRLP
jgi:glutamyl-tRNA synthetase